MELDKTLTALLFIAVLVERAVQWVKNVLPYSKWDTTAPYQQYIDQALVVLLGAVTCVYWKVDLLSIIIPGVQPGAAWVGAAVTGLLIALPSEALHELFELLRLLRREAIARVATKLRSK